MYKIKKINIDGQEVDGISAQWKNGQYCALLTPQGQVGCGIFDIKVMEEFSMVGAIAKGTPEKPLVEPEDLFTAKIIQTTTLAEKAGIKIGMTGKEAVKVLINTNQVS
jgi:uncharacterized protein YunC (DUF1805 family)